MCCFYVYNTLNCSVITQCTLYPLPLSSPSKSTHYLYKMKQLQIENLRKRYVRITKQNSLLMRTLTWDIPEDSKPV